MTDTAARTRWNTSPARVIALACAAAAVVTSGMHGIIAAIPAIQDQFALSEAQVALITSVYLFPGMFSALAAGLLADRIGPRPVLAVALLVFGVGGGVLLFSPGLWLLLGVRLVQGVSFGAVMSLTVAVIGGIVASGPAAARAQGQRTIAIALAQAVFPAVGGLLLAVSWFAPFAMQVLAVPVAVAVWLLVPPVQARRRLSGRASTSAVLHAPGLVGVQALGALRFVFKFAILTYFPVRAVNEVGMSPALVGIALGASALLAALMAWMSKSLARRWSSSQLIGGCLAVTVVSLVGMALGTNAAVLIAAILLYGVQDGVYGVGHNVLVTEMAPADVRSTYIGLTGTVRNVGKFAAPMLFGAATLVLSVSHSFLALAGTSLASVAVAGRVARVQRQLKGDPDEADDSGAA